MPELTENSNSPVSGVAESCAARLTAIKDGGDWHDASVDHVRVPKEMNLREKQHEWRNWLNESDDFLRFTDWLVEFTDAEDATDEVDSFYTMY